MPTNKYAAGPIALLSAIGLVGCGQPGQERLNVIYILADDLGYGDLGCYGQEKILTPNIDGLAAQGMLFTQHYAGCAVSAPSRSSLMTGQHTGHTPIRGNRSALELGMSEGQYPMPAETYTLGKMFKEAGYSTSVFGKWGLGYPGSESGPEAMGIDEFFGYNCQSLAHKYYPEHLWHNSEKVILEGNDLVHKNVYSHDLIHRKAMDHLRDRDGKPFFMFLAYTLPHAELLVPEDSLIQYYRGRFEEKAYEAKGGIGDYSPEGRSKRDYCSQPEAHATFAAMVGRLDAYVGDVMRLVDSLGIADRTIIIFTSDNGPHHEGGADPSFFCSSGPLKGCKRDLYEGGIREPFIACAPGIIPKGTTSDHVCAFWDMMPTFAEMAGTHVDAEIDGISFWPTLTGKGRQREHEYLYWEFHEQGGKKAVRMGNWKAVQIGIAENADAEIELYDLSQDIHEDRNIASEHPEIIERMRSILKTAHTPSEMFNFGQADGTL